VSATCPSCGADQGTVGVTGGHLCPTCLHREGVARIPAGPAMTIEEARLPRKIVQLIPAGERLFCMCDDGTAWEWTANAGPREHWRLLPKPGLPASGGAKCRVCGLGENTPAHARGDHTFEGYPS
jgi:hypothetical protein